MSTTPHFMIVTCTVDPTQSAAFTHTVSHARPILGATGGRPLGHHAAESVLSGEADTPHVIVMEFPSKEAIQAVFADPAYQAPSPARAAAFPRLLLPASTSFDPRAMMVAA